MASSGNLLVSGLTHRSPKMTVAATQMTDMKVWAQRPYRVWMRRQSLEPAEHVLDPVALAVKDAVEGDRDFAVGF